LKVLFSRKALILYAGLAFGVLSALLVKWGNPSNMGFCNLCFLRDVAGGLHLHSAAAVQYVRPEIMGLVLGATAAALLFREFRPRGGGAPLVRFVLGFIIAIGALVFLGCPWRIMIRLGGGDLSALFGLVGLVVGVAIGIMFLRNGFNLGRAIRTKAVTGWIMPAIFAILLIFVVFNASFLASSTSGVGSLHPAVWISLVVGLFIGFVAQRVRFCTVGGWRDLIMVKDTYLLLGILGLFVGTLVTNYLVGFFGDGGVASSTGIVAYHWGFTSQPIAMPGVDAAGNIRWTDFLWDAVAMVLVGLAAVLAGGCPLRQLIMSGEGDTDAGITVIGMMVGSAVAMSFGFASSGAGPGALGPWALVAGLVGCLVIGFTMRERA